MSVRQLSIFLPTERHRPNAVDCHKGGVDEEESQLNQPADATQVEEEIPLGVIRVGVESGFQDSEGFICSFLKTFQGVSLPDVHKDLLSLADGEEDGEDDSEDTRADADEAEEPEEADDEVELRRPLEIVLVCVPVDGHVRIVVIVGSFVLHFQSPATSTRF